MLDRHMLSQLLDWGRPIVGYTTEHARDGLGLAQEYVAGFVDEDGRRVEGVGSSDDRTVLLLALDLSWLLWLDDQFDLRPRGSVDVAALVASARGPATSDEGEGLVRLRTRIADEVGDDPGYAIWLETILDVIAAYRRNQDLGDERWSYAEYLDNGEGSIATAHFVATAALLFRWDLPRRWASPPFRRALRHLCLATRLQNDLGSLDKERAVGTPANAVLVAEQYLPARQAAAFIAGERAGYQRLLDRDLAALDPRDPFVALARIILASTERYYRAPRARYEVCTAHDRRGTGRARITDEEVVP